MSRIEKRKLKNGTISFRVAIRKKGFPLQSATFRDLETAKAWAHQVESNLVNVKNFKILEKSKSNLNFSSVIERYKEEIIPKLNPDGQKKRSSQLDEWVNSFGNVSLDKVDKDFIEKVLNEKSKEITRYNTPVTGATLQRKLAALSHVFTICIVKWGYLKENPCQFIVRPGTKNIRVRQLTRPIDIEDVLWFLSERGFSESELNKIRDKAS